MSAIFMAYLCCGAKNKGDWGPKNFRCKYQAHCAAFSQDFIKLILISLLIASPLAWYTMDSWLQNFAYRIPINGWMYGVAGSLVLLVAMIAVSFPVIKAAF